MVAFITLLSCKKTSVPVDSMSVPSIEISSHLDSVCLFHNLVMDNIRLKTRSGEMAINPPIPVFVDKVSICTEEVLQAHDVNYTVTREQKEKMTDSVSPFIISLLDKEIEPMTQIYSIIDKYFSEECAHCMKQVINDDYLLQPNLSSVSNDTDKEIIQSFYSIGVTSKDYWLKINPSGRINKAAYCADSLGGALSIVYSMTGPAAWFMLIISNAWSAAVDNYDPTAPVEWTNCD